MPGTSKTAILRVAGRRGVPFPASGPHSLRFPAAPRTLAASSGLVVVPLTCPASLCLWISHLLCPVLQTPSSRKSPESFPCGCALPACGCCVIHFTLSQLIRGRLFLRRLEDEGLPYSSCDHSTSWLAHSRCAMVWPTDLMNKPQGLLNAQGAGWDGSLPSQRPFPGPPGCRVGGRRALLGTLAQFWLVIL